MIGKLPQKFTEKMKKLLGAEFDNFMSSYDDQRLYGLRVNRLKLDAAAWKELSAFGADAKPVPWCEEGFYYKEGQRPGKHPHYHAGLYYIQEPSAMAPVELLDVQPGHYVLDLCAAPGGKSTQIAAKLQGSGVLVTNDNARERTKALAKNIELAGVRNAIVLNEEPERLAPVFAEWFDRILIDAPCSGEGMFRKDDSMIADWEKHSVERCSLMQRDILRHAAAMLAPGGRLVYSTCTFSPEENEQQIAAFLAEHNDFDIVPAEHRYGWQPGRPDLAELRLLDGQGSEHSVKDINLSTLAGARQDNNAQFGGGTWSEEANARISAEQYGVNERRLDADRLQSLAGTVRLWPHRLEGEGHYAAVLRRSGERPLRDAGALDSASGGGGNSASGAQPDTCSVNGGPARLRGGKEFVRAEAYSGKGASQAGSRKLPGKRLERADKRAGSERLDKRDRKTHMRGLESGGADRRHRGSQESESAEELWSSQSGQFVTDSLHEMGTLVAYGSRIYIQPPGVPALDGLRVVRAGWFVGEADKGRLTPSHPLALGLEREDAARSISWRSDQPETLRYLKGETVFAEEQDLVLKEGVSAKGYVLVCTDGFPIGWAKFAGGMLKNELPTGWRWM
jgi:NOL1/NOP2/sun family putative RNA methylase